MPHECDEIRDAIESIELQIQLLEADIREAGPLTKPGLFALKESAAEDLRQRRRDLEVCEAGGEDDGLPLPSNIPGIPIVGLEVSQGLPGYDLVAGKDTLVRLFVTGQQGFLFLTTPPEGTATVPVSVTDAPASCGASRGCSWESGVWRKGEGSGGWRGGDASCNGGARVTDERRAAGMRSRSERKPILSERSG